jgi:hypothetical protein
MKQSVKQHQSHASAAASAPPSPPLVAVGMQSAREHVRHLFPVRCYREYIVNIENQQRVACGRLMGSRECLLDLPMAPR